MEGILAIMGGLLAGLRGKRRAAMEECLRRMGQEGQKLQGEIDLAERNAMCDKEELREENRRLKEDAGEDLVIIQSLKAENYRLKEEADDDLATIQFLKEENSRLKEEADRLRGEGGLAERIAEETQTAALDDLEESDCVVRSLREENSRLKEEADEDLATIQFLKEANRRLKDEADEDLATIHSLRTQNRKLREEADAESWKSPPTQDVSSAQDVSPAQFRAVLEALGVVPCEVRLSCRWVADNKVKATKAVRTVRENMRLKEAVDWVKAGAVAIGPEPCFALLGVADAGQLEQLFAILGLPGKDWKLL